MTSPCGVRPQRLVLDGGRAAERGAVLRRPDVLFISHLTNYGRERSNRGQVCHERVPRLDHDRVEGELCFLCILSTRRRRRLVAGTTNYEYWKDYARLEEEEP